MSPRAWPLLVVYDGRCAFCSGVVDWLRRHDRAGRLVPVPNQVPALIDRLGLSRAAVEHSVWVIWPGGRRVEGAAAVNAILTALGGGWSQLARLARLPVLRALEAAAYGFVARHRHRIGWFGRPAACDRRGVTCVAQA